MAQTHKFASLAERKRYYAQRTFGIEPTPPPRSASTRSMTRSEYDMLQAISQTVEDQYDRKNNGEVTKIPYYTNNVSGVNIFKENRHPQARIQGYYLRDILQKIIGRVLTMNNYDASSIHPSSVLLHLQYPIETTPHHDYTNMIFDSSVVDMDEYVTVKITDIILYSIVKDCSKHFMALSGVDDIYLMGSDILSEDYMLTDPEFDSYFITITKAIYATTLIGRNIDQLGLMDYPSYQFSVGTYAMDEAPTNKFVRILASNTLIHVLPLWTSVFNASFLLELTTTDVHFSYQHDTLFSYFERDIDTVCFHQVSDRTEAIINVPARVCLSSQDDVDPFDVYLSNLNTRNKLSSRLDHVKNFNKVKDKMYPKNRDGAKTKLQSCLTHLDISQYKSVLDLGSAPGTWIDHLMELDHFSTIVGVTPDSSSVNLPMYPQILNRIKENPLASIVFTDAETYLASSQSFDLIVSDLATKHNNYLTQSLDHDPLYTHLISTIPTKLNLGGSFVMKMYDMTPKMYELIPRVLSTFADFRVVKPVGSCPTNPEVYLIGIDYRGASTLSSISLVSLFNQILISQISNLNHLLTRGFGVHAEYHLSHINNRLNLQNIEYLPYHLIPCLSSLRFSESLYPHNLTGRIHEEVTLLGDKYVRFTWDVPRVPETSVCYITHTTVGYESNGMSLSHLLLIHHGFIFEDNIKKDFFIIEKEASFLFSEHYAVTCVVSHYSNHLPENQFTMDDLLSSPRYLALFPTITTFGQLDYYIRQLSLKTYFELQQYHGVISCRTILNQFFRESETMRLSYAKSELYTLIQGSKTQRTHKTLNLSKQNDRKTFVTLYKENTRTGKTPRQTFCDMLNKYTIQVWEGELLTSAICTTTNSYIERKTGQICVSQPACVQFRRQQHI